MPCLIVSCILTKNENCTIQHESDDCLQLEISLLVEMDRLANVFLLALDRGMDLFRSMTMKWEILLCQRISSGITSAGDRK